MSNRTLSGKKIDVAIIGGGPAGLSAAIELKRCGVSRVVVFEREPEAGGIPRHCGHPPFGLREFKRLLTGPQYAKKLVKQAESCGVELHVSTSVVEARRGGILLVATQNGQEEIAAERVIIATGVREKPRSARLISGLRQSGVVNTGALQSMVYLKNSRPFKRPVIIGTELVSFSAILTCRHAKIIPVAMIGENDKVLARWPVGLFPHLVRLPLMLNQRLKRILGHRQVSGVELQDRNGQTKTIECDGVILSGQFTPEASIARSGHLKIDTLTGGPIVDQYGRCSDPTYFAAGNILRPVETAGWSWNEGRRIGSWVANDLTTNNASDSKQIRITVNHPFIKLAMPQRITQPLNPNYGMKDLQLRFSAPCKGDLVASDATGVVFRKYLNVSPERRVLVSLPKLLEVAIGEHLHLEFEETQ